MKNFSKIRSFAKGILLLVIVCFFAVSFLTQPTMTNMATVEAASLGVYWDINCTGRVGSIDWGSLYRGSQENVNVYIRNEGDGPVYLSLDTTDWQPSKASQFMSLDWNYNKQMLYPAEVMPLTLRLSVSSIIIGITAFSFNIVVSPADFIATVILELTLDQDNYVVADISLSSALSLAGGIGAYALNLSVLGGIAALSVSGGKPPFDKPPNVSRADGKIIVAASITETQGPQMSNLNVARLRLRLNDNAGVESILRPLGLVVMDATNRTEYVAAVQGEPLRFVRGDANGDGSISIADAMFIAQYLVGNRPWSDLSLLNAASVKYDGDGGDKVTVADAMFIAQYLVGLRPEGL